MSTFRADLHCHSTCSDGTVSPQGLIKLAMQVGLQGLSITDHDTINAYTTALPLAKELGLRLISGVEFSALYGKISVHVLGYSFDLNNTGIHEFCKKHQIRREKRNREILDKLATHKMTITMKEIEECAGPNHGTVGRPHIALAMKQKGYVKSLEEAFKKWLGEGRPGYAPGNQFQVEETLHIIHEAGGLAVIAHPHLLQNDRTLKRLLEMPFDGIECYYARMAPDQNQRWLNIAKEKKWLITGGSDFHGEVKELIPLGSSWVDQEHFKPLEKQFYKVGNTEIKIQNKELA